MKTMVLVLLLAIFVISCDDPVSRECASNEFICIDSEQILACESGKFVLRQCADHLYCKEKLACNEVCNEVSVTCHDSDYQKVCEKGQPPHYLSCSARNQRCDSGSCLSQLCNNSESICREGVEISCFEPGMEAFFERCEFGCDFSGKYCEDAPEICDATKTVCKNGVNEVCVKGEEKIYYSCRSNTCDSLGTNCGGSEDDTCGGVSTICMAGDLVECKVLGLPSEVTHCVFGCGSINTCAEKPPKCESKGNYCIENYIVECAEAGQDPTFQLCEHGCNPKTNACIEFCEQTGTTCRDGVNYECYWYSLVPTPTTCEYGCNVLGTDCEVEPGADACKKRRMQTNINMGVPCDPKVEVGACNEVGSVWVYCSNTGFTSYDACYENSCKTGTISAENPSGCGLDKCDKVYTYSDKSLANCNTDTENKCLEEGGNVGTFCTNQNTLRTITCKDGYRCYDDEGYIRCVNF